MKAEIAKWSKLAKQARNGSAARKPKPTLNARASLVQDLRIVEGV